MQKFSYYQFVKEAARIPGGKRQNGRSGRTRLNKYPSYSFYGGMQQGVSSVRDNSTMQAIVDDVAAYGRMGRQQAKKLVAAASQIAQATGSDIKSVLKSVLAKGKGAANRAGTAVKSGVQSAGAAVKSGVEAAGAGLDKAKATAAAGKDALVGAYEKAKPVVQEAGQKALEWLGSHRQGLRDIGLGALLGDALLDED